MTTRHPTRTPPRVASPRRRPARPLDLFSPPPEARTAAALDDAEHAAELIADLLALAEAGLIEPVADPAGNTRYAPTRADVDPAS